MKQPTKLALPPRALRWILGVLAALTTLYALLGLLFVQGALGLPTRSADTSASHLPV